MGHWTDQYVGLPYINDEFDCVHLATKVQNEVFGKSIQIPVAREEHIFKLSKQIEEHMNTYYEEVPKEEAQDGDLILMKCKGRLNHTGVYCVIDGVPYVLHNLRSIGSVALHRIRELDKHGMIYDSVYRVKAGNAINTSSAKQEQKE